MNTQTNDGGPAFPVQDEGEWLDPKTCTQWQPFNGMTLRDYFAGQALAGYLADTRCPDRATPKTVAEWCYSNADAMLSARERKEGA